MREVLSDFMVGFNALAYSEQSFRSRTYAYRGTMFSNGLALNNNLVTQTNFTRKPNSSGLIMLAKSSNVNRGAGTVNVLADDPSTALTVPKFSCAPAGDKHPPAANIPNKAISFPVAISSHNIRALRQDFPTLRPILQTADERRTNRRVLTGFRVCGAVHRAVRALFSALV